MTHYFEANNRCERLGAVGIFNVDLPAEVIRYRFSLFENPHALPNVVVPSEVVRGYPRYTNTGRVA